MKKNFVIITFSMLIMGMFGCSALNNATQGIAEKDISGAGTIAISRAGLDKTTQTPELFNLLVIGDYNSAKEGTVARIEYAEDASVFNSQSISKKYKCVIMSQDKKETEELINLTTSHTKTIMTTPPETN